MASSEPSSTTSRGMRPCTSRIQPRTQSSADASTSPAAASRVSLDLSLASWPGRNRARHGSPQHSQRPRGGVPAALFRPLSTVSGRSAGGGSTIGRRPFVAAARSTDSRWHAHPHSCAPPAGVRYAPGHLRCSRSRAASPSATSTRPANSQSGVITRGPISSCRRTAPRTPVPWPGPAAAASRCRSAARVAALTSERTAPASRPWLTPTPRARA